MVQSLVARNQPSWVGVNHPPDCFETPVCPFYQDLWRGAVLAGMNVSEELQHFCGRWVTFDDGDISDLSESRFCIRVRDHLFEKLGAARDFLNLEELIQISDKEFTVTLSGTAEQIARKATTVKSALAGYGVLQAWRDDVRRVRLDVKPLETNADLFGYAMYVKDLIRLKLFDSSGCLTCPLDPLPERHTRIYC